MDGQTDGGDYNIPFAFLKKRWDNQQQQNRTTVLEQTVTETTLV